MLPAESILFLFDRLKHKGGRIHRLLNGWELSVLLEVDATVSTQQDVLPPAVVPVLGGFEQEEGKSGQLEYQTQDG